MTGGEARGGACDARTRGVALAVLLRDGLPAWLAAVEPLLSIRSAAPVHPVMERTAPDETQPGRAVAPDVLPPARQAEVTLVLAALVLSTARSARRDLSRARAREGALR